MRIGVTGYAQHGKDTVASVLVSEYGFKRLAFADALKELALKVDPIVRNPYLPAAEARLSWTVAKFGWEEAKSLEEVRRLLQELGTGAREILGDDIWTRIIARKMRSTYDPVVISDVRFPNEAEMIHWHGGEIWRVIRITPEGASYDNGIGIDHPSEAQIADIDFDKILVAHDVPSLQESVRKTMDYGQKKIEAEVEETIFYG